MEDERIQREAEELAARHMMEFGKSYRTYMNHDEINAVENCMQVAGCNDCRYPDISRRIQAWLILRYCIASCDRTELRKIETALLEIAAR